MTRAWPNAYLIRLPAHGSWLDQAEIYFSIRYNAIARPFSWKFTRTDLDDLLHRIDAHERLSSTPWQHELQPRRANGCDH